MASPEALELLGGLILEDGRTFAEAAYPWQYHDAQAILRPDGPRRHFLLRGRGLSKTTDVAAAAVALLLTEAPERSRSLAFAVDSDQAAHLADALAGFVERTEGLQGAVEIEARRLIVRSTGATLTVESSDGASAFGARPWLQVVDELAMWPATPNHRRLWSAIASAAPKVPGSRLVVISAAGSPTGLGAKVWEEAVGSEHWRTSTTPGPAPWWTADDVEATRASLTEAEFRRLIACEWAEGDDALTTPEDVYACVGHTGPLEPVPDTAYTMALDVGTRRDATVVVVAHCEQHEGARRVVVDRVLRWRGTRAHPVSLDDVEAAVGALWDAYAHPPLVYDLHQAAQITERLQARGVRCVEFGFTVAGTNRLARTLYTLIRDRAIVLPDDPELIEELVGVRLVETGPGLVRLDHRAGSHDDQAVALGMAAAHLLDRPATPLKIWAPTGWRARNMFRGSPGPAANVPAPGEAPTPASIGRSGRGPIDWTRSSPWWR